MASFVNRLRPAVWDRLTRADGDFSELPGKLASYGLHEHCESIRRDLSRLLNSNSCCRSWPVELVELRKSSINFGIEDPTGVNVLNGQSREYVRRSLESIIRDFEPRLTAVHVSVLADGETSDRTLRFRINARLALHDESQTISFESKLDSQSRRFGVEVLGR